NSLIDKMFPLKNRNILEDLLRKNTNPVFIFCGHYHNEYEVIKNNIKQYVTPSGIVQIKKDSNKLEIDSLKYGYRIIEINNNNICTFVKYM
ncbi:MAG TPA: hypothetical protein PK771_07515, partial [Spirochaetota bacterium]|nr:hypothetical protein [Spirochaetota bacterium]